MLVNADYHSTAGCDHADEDDPTLNAKKLYLMISVMLHASKRDIKFSWMEYGPMGRMVMPPLAIWAGAATMMPHTTQTLEETCIAAGQHIQETLLFVGNAVYMQPYLPGGMHWSSRDSFEQQP